MMTKVTIKAIENGPYIIDVDGHSTALCRCGASNNKPYCDGSHSKIEFKANTANIIIE